jgi:hypothetical protein
MRNGLIHVAGAAVLAVVLSAGVAQAEEYAYIGTKGCKKCHIKQWRSWSETKMARAYETLKPGVAAEAKEGVGFDPEFDYTTVEGCVKCHVTGFGKEGGFVDLETTPDLAGIGCESCHGAGGTFTREEYMSLRNKNFLKSEVVAVGLVDTVSAAQCVICHNAESPFVSADDTFSFDELREADTHEHFALKYEH